MPEKTFPNALDDVIAARDWLAREVEQLEVARKRIIEIRYPKLLAERLRITATEDSARYGKHKAVGHRGEYQIVIEHAD